MKSHWHGIWLLKQSIIINIWFNYMKRLFFYYSRYPHDIRMKYCGWGCGCQNSCGYPRIRMRSSDTPLISSYLLIAFWPIFQQTYLLYSYQFFRQHRKLLKCPFDSSNWFWQFLDFLPSWVKSCSHHFCLIFAAVQIAWPPSLSLALPPFIGPHLNTTILSSKAPCQGQLVAFVASSPGNFKRRQAIRWVTKWPGENINHPSNLVASR